MLDAREEAVAYLGAVAPKTNKDRWFVPMLVPLRRCWMQEFSVWCCAALVLGSVDTVLRDRTRQTMYVQWNIEGRSRNHCCRGTAVNITYFKCVLVAVVIQRQMRHIVICVLFRSTGIFAHYLINRTIFRKNKY